MSIKSKIQSLIAAANTATGGSDATLTDAVQTLVDGYGQGGGGDSSLLNSLIDRTIISINYSGSTIGDNAFDRCQELETISAPDVTSIGNNAFSYCDELKNPVFPKVTSVGSDAFSYSGIEEVTQTNFPLFTSVSTAAFRNCSKLARVFLPSSMIGQQAFLNCVLLKTAVFNSLNYTYNFSKCSVLEAVDKTGSGSVATGAFDKCSVLTTVVLRSSTLCALSNTNAFSVTPFASGGTGGTLYVPQALVSQYTQATNWSTILGYANNKILPIEGSIYETQYADGTSIT